MQNYPGTLVADPPVNMNEGGVIAGTNLSTMLDPSTTAWQIYIGHVALTLAAEMHGWIPWSIHNYDFAGMTALFDSGFAAGSLPGATPVQSATPGNAITTFKFLKTNNLIGSTRQDTIDRVLTWSRWNLTHMIGDYSAPNYYSYWQYWGKMPVSRVISGTVSQNPDAINVMPGTHHWTQGCYGTTAFLIWVFKASNIPVKEAPVGYHLTPYFVSENLYLSHGDDPYTEFSRNLKRPIRELLFDAAVYKKWYPSTDKDAADKNVGRRVVELNFAYPTIDLAKQHQKDKDAGLSREKGQVFAYMGKVYTMAQLDAGGFWTRLEAVLPPLM